MHEGISRVRFDNNKAFYGGALSANDHSNITLTGNSVLLFANNEATQSGGAGYFTSHCYFILNKASNVSFDSNKAFNGGAIFINALTNFLVKEIPLHFSVVIWFLRVEELYKFQIGQLLY